MNILLTGSEGVVGTILKKHLKHRNKLTCIDLKDNSGDILDKEKVENIFKTKSKFDAIIHCANLCNSKESQINPDIYYDTNVKGTKILVDLADKYEVDKFIFMSSGSIVYLDSPYTAFKKISEKHVLDRKYGKGINLRLESLLKTDGDVYKLNSYSFLDNLLYSKTNNANTFVINGNNLRKFITPELLLDKIEVLLYKKSLESSTYSFEYTISIKLLTALNIFLNVFGQVSYKIGANNKEEVNLTGIESNVHLFKEALLKIKNMAIVGE